MHPIVGIQLDAHSSCGAALAFPFAKSSLQACLLMTKGAGISHEELVNAHRLAIKAVVDAMGGYIELDEEYKSDLVGFPGARFVVNIPNCRILEPQVVTTQQQVGTTQQQVGTTCVDGNSLVNLFNTPAIHRNYSFS